jgi:hypothetical protein
MGDTRHLTTGPRALAILLPAAAILGLPACGAGGGNQNPPKMTNVPGAVGESPAGSGKLSGHFQIRPAQPGDPFIFSAGVGGACHVTQYPVAPQSCTRHSECGLPSDGTGNGASAYCLAESPGSPTAGGGGGVPPSGAGTCWIKPSEDFCLKGVTEGRHDTPSADTALIVSKQHVKTWRVLTCLNGAPGACGGAPATPNELQHQAGPVYTAP